MIKLDTKKMFATFLLVSLVLSLVYIFRMHKNAKDIVTYKEYIDELKNQKDSIIALNLNNIKILKADIDGLKLDNFLYMKQVESLKRVKAKIRIVYKKKYEEIDNFQGDEIESFWKEKFN